MTSDNAADDGIRLQKVLASAGVASRRVSEDLIVAGRVRVNGTVVTELGRRIHPETDLVAVDNVAVQLDNTKLYLMLNKPAGVYSSMRDERGRTDLSYWAEQYEERIFNVGRLDAETTGLLIMTNDGDLAHTLAHPSFGVAKTYIAKVEGRVSPQTIAQLTRGIDLEDGPIAADKARLMTSASDSTSSLVEITLHSGRNRIVRRMLDAVGHPVIDLVRRQFGPLHLGTLQIGQIRPLTSAELGQVLTLSRDGADRNAENSADEDSRTDPATGPEKNDGGR
ncbi:pseudouridine synthase [Leifsonia sp. YIM 134122]|uniref:Pseudouridine synthase n=1 Tax=Leifsonia stereocauli TaxID=3134136 RepID=A0ABU9W472_9MICO